MTGDTTRTGAAHLYDALVDAGVDLAVGIPGRGSLPLDTRIRDGEEIDYVMARHETAIPYVAWGYFEAGGGPAATITVPGPGDTNASNGLRNATIDRVPLVHVSTDTPPEHRGKGALHEIDPGTYDDVVKANVDVTNPQALPEAVARGIERALSRPYGPARLGVPFLREDVEAAPATVSPERVTRENDAAYDRAAALLADAERPVIYTGVGARRSPGGSEGVRALVDALDAPVIGSFKGKGVFPETDPHWAGNSGAQLPPGAVRLLERADVVLALGAAFTGPTTQNWSLPMGEALIHVTLDPDRIDAAYESTVGIVDDVGAACDALDARLAGRDAGGWDGAALGERVRAEFRDHLADEGLLDEGAPARLPATILALREALPDEAIVVADIAEFRPWAMQLFEAPAPESFVATDYWTSMGVGLPGAIGAKLAEPDRPVVCLTGDGGLMMCDQELHTAAECGANVTTVVFDNADYAMISSAPELAGQSRFDWSSPDFEKLAEGYGCGATAVETPAGAAAAVRDSFETDRPELVAVRVAEEAVSALNYEGYETTLDV